ncbi:hypothetical protein B0H17DRAFT_1123952 [Mycena rosella]|uniref:Uncharacterized protein n=1 Tax=Mycena rosella TaxID=1033263 RepID=A0AAD7H2T1_MYCRO|nr:hypothetical protein B0H17DRAFT_1123952 [Mycena rosella]
MCARTPYPSPGVEGGSHARAGPRSSGPRERCGCRRCSAAYEVHAYIRPDARRARAGDVRAQRVAEPRARRVHGSLSPEHGHSQAHAPCPGDTGEDPVALITPLPGACFDLSGGPPTPGRGASAPAVYVDEGDFCQRWRRNRGRRLDRPRRAAACAEHQKVYVCGRKVEGPHQEGGAGTRIRLLRSLLIFCRIAGELEPQS